MLKAQAPLSSYFSQDSDEVISSASSNYFFSERSLGVPSSEQVKELEAQAVKLQRELDFIQGLISLKRNRCGL